MTVKKETEEKYAEICYILLGKKKKIPSWEENRGLLQFLLRIITSLISAFLWLQTKIAPMSHNNYLRKTSHISMKHRLWLQDECFKTRPFRQPLLERVSLACYSPGTRCHADHFPPRGVRELMDKAASEQVCWTPGRRWGGKHRESAFPPRQVPRQNVTDVTVPELWSLPETCSFQGKAWKVNCLYFLSISALSSPAVTHPNLHPMAGSCAPVPKAAGMKSARARVAKKDLVLQKSGVYVLVTGCRFWS